MSVGRGGPGSGSRCKRELRAVVEDGWMQLCRVARFELESGSSLHVSVRGRGEVGGVRLRVSWTWSRGLEVDVQHDERRCSCTAMMRAAESVKTNGSRSRSQKKRCLRTARQGKGALTGSVGEGPTRVQGREVVGRGAHKPTDSMNDAVRDAEGTSKVLHVLNEQ